MRLEKCPRCGAKVQPTDTLCMDCGLDLVEARKKIAADAKQSAPKTSSEPQIAVANPAAAGIATDVGEATRIREFDEELADKLRAERGASIITAIIGFVAGVALLVVGWQLLNQVGGFKSLTTLTPAYMRDRGFGLLADMIFLGAVALGLGLSGLLVCIGQLHRAYTGTQAIQDVTFGGRPRVVGISAFTVIGLLIAAFLLPPFGIIMGIIFKFSPDPDTRDLGGRMILLGIIAIVAFGILQLWGLAGNLKASTPQKPPAASAVQ